MRLSDLQNKKIINIIDGKDMGKIIDVVIDSTGKVIEIIVEKHKFFISFFSSMKEIKIKWEQIDKIGEDVIFVNIVL